MRTADDKLACGVDVVFDVVAEECEHLLRLNLLFHSWHKDLDDVILYLGKHLLVLVKLVVLCGYHDGVDAFGHTAVTVLHSHLALRVRSKIIHDLALLAYVGKGFHYEMCKVKRHGHIVLRFVSGITEHHSLVAGTLFLLVAVVNAAVDVAALFVYGAEYSA